MCTIEIMHYDKDKLKFHKNMSDKIQLEKMQQKMAKKNRKNDKS